MSAQRRRFALTVAAAGVLVEAIAIRRLGYPFAGNVVVRCRRGHVFTTIWVPGASIKALRLGPWRVQRCPVGGHWSLVTPVSRADLTAKERRAADETRDVRVP
jgi:hypothetical protein